MKNNLILFIYALPTIFLLLYFFTDMDINIFNKKPDTTPICDIEKKSKFILECLKADTTKDLLAIGACEQMSLRLYCK